jgi:hypothetical protein
MQGRVFNVSVFDGDNVSHTLNYSTAPDVLVWSAVLASAAVPGALPPQELMMKDGRGRVVPCHSFGKCWRDGSLKNDLPITQLHQQFNVNWTIVSQVEPHLAPFFYNARGSAGCPSPHLDGKGFRGGFVLAYLEGLLKKEMMKWLGIMRDFELLPAIGGVNWGDLFLQTNFGDVTVVPEQRWLDYPNLIQDPDAVGMARYIREGERATWPKLGIIRDHRLIELELIHQQCRLREEQGGVETPAGEAFRGELPQSSRAREHLSHHESPQRSRNAGMDPHSVQRSAKCRHERDLAVSELQDMVGLAMGLRESCRRAKRMARVYHALIAFLLSLLYAALWWAWNDAVSLVMDSVHVHGLHRLVQLGVTFSGTMLLMSWIYEWYLTE